MKTANLDPNRQYKYEEIISLMEAGEYTCAVIVTAARRRFPLVGISNDQLQRIKNAALRYNIGLILTGSRVVGPRTHQRTLHPALHDGIALTANSRAASINYKRIDGVTIEKNAIKEFGVNSPHTSDLSVLVIDSMRRPLSVQRDIAAALAKEFDSLGCSFPIRVFVELNGHLFASEAEYIDFGCRHFLQKDLPPNHGFSTADLRNAFKELYTTINLNLAEPNTAREVSPSWTDVDNLKSAEYANAANLHTRLAFYRRFSTNPRGWGKWLFDQIGLTKLDESAVILDIGCGTASVWKNNAESIPSSWRIFLSDLSLGMLLEVRQERTPATGIVCGDVRQIAFASKAFDAVCVFHILYHVEQRERAYDEIARVLKPTGVLFASSVGARHLIELRQMLSCFDEQLSLYLVPRTFLLDDAENELSGYFKDIQIVRYKDDLEVTDPKGLIDYVRSTNVRSYLTGEGMLRFVEHVNASVRNDSPFHISTESGLIIARFKEPRS